MPENDVEQRPALTVTSDSVTSDSLTSNSVTSDSESRVQRYLSGPVIHLLGNPDAPICVVEYGDYECPYCAGAAPVLRELVDSSAGQVRLIFRNFPLFEVHPHALTTALAAESVAATAGEEVFWQMHQKLFIHQSRLTDVDLKMYAKALGADPELAAGDGAQQFAPIVEADYASGIAVGVSATPTLFIQGNPYTGRVDVPSLRRATGQPSSAAAAASPADASAGSPAGSSAQGAAQARRRPWQRRK